jgi:hypothetical protein
MSHLAVAHKNTRYNCRVLCLNRKILLIRPKARYYHCASLLDEVLFVYDEADRFRFGLLRDAGVFG